MKRERMNHESGLKLPNWTSPEPVESVADPGAEHRSTWARTFAGEERDRSVDRQAPAVVAAGDQNLQPGDDVTTSTAVEQTEI